MTVNSVEIRLENDLHYGLVEFKLAKAASAALSSTEIHRIGDSNIQVKAAEPWQQPD